MSVKIPPNEELREMVRDMAGWALSRIRHCRALEDRFGAASTGIKAAVERRALTAVLSQLDIAVPPREGKEGT